MRWIAFIVVAACAGCVTAGPSQRSLHLMEGELVHSRPVSAAAYESYLRARLALDANPPELAAARASINRAVRYDPHDPHIWTTKAEIEALAGRERDAMSSANRALELRPGYTPASRVVTRLGRGQVASAEVPGRRRSH